MAMPAWPAPTTIVSTSSTAMSRLPLRASLVATETSAAQEFLGVAVEPLLDDLVLERQLLVEGNALRDGQVEGILRETDHDLFLQQRVAEREEHLPARARHAEVRRMVGRGVGVEVGMTPHQADQVVDPRPAAQ